MKTFKMTVQRTPSPHQGLFPLRILLLVLLIASLSFPCPALGGPARRGRTVHVKRVIDGDTIVTTGGEHIRYIGMDTPEYGEPFFSEAREANRALLGAGAVVVVECRREKRDRYGRTLAWVYAGGRLVNGELLRRGLARPLVIPPCGLEKRSLMERLWWQARSRGRGIWQALGGVESAPGITPREAGRHAGEMVRVSGRVSGVRETPGAVFIDLGSRAGARTGGHENGLTLVIFPGGLQYFREAGMEPAGLAGREVSVTGVIRTYRGKMEIILVDPGQVRLKKGKG